MVDNYGRRKGKNENFAKSLKNVINVQSTITTIVDDINNNKNVNLRNF